MVTHVDASKGHGPVGRENAEASGIADRPVRWLVDDCLKFVQREQRRGRTYDGIIMDPPSYGRGPWRRGVEAGGAAVQPHRPVRAHPHGEAAVFHPQLLHHRAFPSVMEYLLGVQLQKRFGGKVSSDEIGLPVTSTGLVLPCGSTAIYEA